MQVNMTKKDYFEILSVISYLASNKSKIHKLRIWQIITVRIVGENIVLSKL